MNDNYINQKIKEIIDFISGDIFPEISRKKRFLRLILKAVWLDGKAEGVQSAREILKE